MRQNYLCRGSLRINWKEVTWSGMLKGGGTCGVKLYDVEGSK